MAQYSKCYPTEKLFLIPEKSLTVVNSDNAMSVAHVDVNSDTQTFSNQTILGKAHPRTKIAPIITARPLDLEYWKDTPMTTISIINKRKPQYPSLAGYNTADLTDRECLETYPLRESLSTTAQASPLVQTLQPGVYTLPADYEPILDNMGISETPQFEKIKSVPDRGNIVFEPLKQPTTQPTTQPTMNESQPSESLPNSKRTSFLPTTSRVRENYDKNVSREVGNDASTYNVYDPRFSGYGSDNRAYLDPMLHQTRYYYDDVDAIRRPNYIVRSKLDNCVTGFGDTYGPMHDYQLSLNQTRPLAEKAYLDNHMNYRNDLMESLMKKRNAEIWQNRQAPKYTTRQSLK